MLPEGQLIGFSFTPRDRFAEEAVGARADKKHEAWGISWQSVGRALHECGHEAEHNLDEKAAEVAAHRHAPLDLKRP